MNVVVGHNRVRLYVSGSRTSSHVLGDKNRSGATLASTWTTLGRQRCLPCSVALVLCARLHTFPMFFAYLLVLSLFPPLPPLLSSSPRPNLCYLLGSPSFGLPLGSPCALVYTLSQCFFATSGMVLYLARLASACLWVRPVRSFTHFSNCFLLLLEWCCTWLALLWLGSLGSGTCLGSLAGVGPETRARPSILVLAWLALGRHCCLDVSGVQGFSHKSDVYTVKTI
jgi:hypothetical protein